MDRYRAAAPVASAAAPGDGDRGRGDRARAGSRYVVVVDNTRATASGNVTSGSINPSFRDGNYWSARGILHRSGLRQRR